MPQLSGGNAIDSPATSRDGADPGCEPFQATSRYTFSTGDEQETSYFKVTLFPKGTHVRVYESGRGREGTVIGDGVPGVRRVLLFEPTEYREFHPSDLEPSRRAKESARAVDVERNQAALVLQRHVRKASRWRKHLDEVVQRAMQEAKRQRWEREPRAHQKDDAACSCSLDSGGLPEPDGSRSCGALSPIRTETKRLGEPPRGGGGGCGLDESSAMSVGRLATTQRRREKGGLYARFETLGPSGNVPRALGPKKGAARTTTLVRDRVGRDLFLDATATEVLDDAQPPPPSSLFSPICFSSKSAAPTSASAAQEPDVPAEWAAAAAVAEEKHARDKAAQQKRLKRERRARRAAAARGDPSIRPRHRISRSSRMSMEGEESGDDVADELDDMFAALHAQEARLTQLAPLR